MTRTSINETTGRPWADDLPDIPLFTTHVLELSRADAFAVKDEFADPLYDALEAIESALMTGSDQAMDNWGAAYDPEWGQS